jgi:DNA-directed RNA polymerase III subunit RPC11
MTARTHMKRKDVDDVLGGEDQWKHADSTPGQLLRLFELDT